MGHGAFMEAPWGVASLLGWPFTLSQVGGKDARPSQPTHSRHWMVASREAVRPWGRLSLGPKGSLSSMGLAAEDSPGALLAASSPEAVCVAHCGTCHIIRTCPRSQGGDRGFLLAATALPSLSLSPVAPQPLAKKPSCYPSSTQNPQRRPLPMVLPTAEFRILVLLGPATL